jgi:serine O-acetyltransferase
MADGRRPPEDLHALVEALCSPNHGVTRESGRCSMAVPLPSRDAVSQLTEDLRSVIFPGYFGTAELDAESLRYHLGATLDRVRRTLAEQVKRSFCFQCGNPGNYPACIEEAERTTHAFLQTLPEVQRLAGLDAQAFYEGDPAVRSHDEAIFCYPGLLAILHFRLAHELHRQHVPLLPRMMTEHAHSLTGVDIHPGATIGERFFIDHATGVVIGETTVIGDRVKIYQGVTLGAKSFPLDAEGHPIKGIPRHPIIEDDVVIYAGATILGRVTIGRGSTIGGNVWLDHDVPPGSRVTQARESSQG